jgi:S-adenosyl methyltransferase
VGSAEDPANSLADSPAASRPHMARVYDYMLGGTSNFAADRALGDQIVAAMPDVQVGVRAQRAVLGRVVSYLAGQAGIRQFLDIGSGLPTADNVHQIAQRANPAARVAYVDNDPLVLSQATELVAGDPATIVSAGDLRDPGRIVASPQLRAHLDFSEPVGLLLCGILHYIPDDGDPAGLVAALGQALPAGSCLFIQHLLASEDAAHPDVQATMQAGLGSVRFRTRTEVTRMFAGFELIEPGLVLVPQWRPDPDTPSERDWPVLRLACAGVARKPRRLAV